MTPVVGYTDRASVGPGGEIGCHVSLISDGAAPASEVGYDAEFGRVVGVSDDGGVERVERISSAVDGRYVARVEPTVNGSFGTAGLALRGDPPEGLAAEVTFMPTLFEGREQGLISVCETGARGLEGFTLAIDAARRPVLVVGGGRSEVSRFVLEATLAEGYWYRMVGGFHAAEAFAAIVAIDDPGFSEADRTWPLALTPEVRSPTAYLACRPSARDDGLRLGSKFTGRLEDPAVATPDGSARAAPTSLGGLGELVARWDLGQGASGFTIHDTSGNDNHGELFGLPMRSATGSNWDRSTTSVHDAPEQYRAVHFFADAIEDAGWPQAFSITIPPDLQSGLYAFVLRTEGECETIPFVVSPPRSSPADVLLILPTATYLAYSNARFMWERAVWEVQRERTVEFGREEQILLDHPEFGASSYDQYRDGSNITSISWRRPNLDMRVGQCRGESYPSDLRLIQWLEDQGYRYDVGSDGDLDQAGTALLDSYRVAVTGTHPEYASTRCYDALESFVAEGGRLAVLGGDIYTWLVAFSTERPWIMEVRKPDHRPAGSRAAAEGHLALTGEFSGDPDGPRPAERLLGTSSTSMGFDAPRPYERLPASDDPDVAFIFAGITSRVIGDDSREGGVVFQEWDNTEEVDGFAFGDESPKVLARSTAHSVTTRWFGAGKRRSHAEMTFFTTGGGGAVFSASSMAWCLCLDRDDVSSITANVLDRFLDPESFRTG